LVTIPTDNLGLNDFYVVTMGVMGSRGVIRIQVATKDTAGEGRVTKTFTIPDALLGLFRIAIRLLIPDTGYCSYNLFNNFDTNLYLPGTVEPLPSSTAPYSGHPHFNITAVDKAATDTFQGYNFPPDTTFDVRMNWIVTTGKPEQS
jgi:hypothetical protein